MFLRFVVNLGGLIVMNERIIVLDFESFDKLYLFIMILGAVKSQEHCP